jgi:predicted phage-related endonuclease
MGESGSNFTPLINQKRNSDIYLLVVVAKANQWCNNLTTGACASQGENTMIFKREITTHATEAAWLADRKTVITSTEAAALFGVGVYVKTPYELFNLKAGVIQPDEFEGNERTRWGNRLEAPIAYGVAEDLGLIVEPYKVFVTMPEFRIGSSFDFIITGITEDFDGDNEARQMFLKHGKGLLEIKNVDGLQFKRGWAADGDHIEAPVHIEAQVQWQMEIADLNWSILAPLVGGNTPHPIIRMRDADFGNAIRTKATEFWQRVNAMAPPEPDFTKDGGTIAKVYRENDGTSVDMSDNARLAALCKAYKKAGADEKAAKELKDAAKAEILTIVQHAKSVAYADGRISAGTNKESFRAYYRNPSEKLTITLTPIAGANIEATVLPFRNVRITEAA